MTIGCSIRYADGASYFRVEDWITTDDFKANTEVLAGILQHWYYGSGLYDRTDSWNAANCIEVIESVIQANNDRRLAGQHLRRELATGAGDPILIPGPLMARMRR